VGVGGDHEELSEVGLQLAARTEECIGAYRYAAVFARQTEDGAQAAGGEIGIQKINPRWQSGVPVCQ
jgi:hypothetical protein